MNITSVMKFTSKLFVVAVLFILVSCSEDDKPVRKLVIDDETMKLAHGYLVDNGVYYDNNEDQATQYDIILTTKDLTVDENVDPVGSGDFIYFELFSTEIDELPDGTYVFNDSYFLGDLLDVQAGIGLGTDNNISFYAVEGAITLKKSGDNYKITFDLTMVQEGTETEVQVNGKYEGKLTFIDNSEIIIEG
jgi:hypothetical protein